MLRPTSSRPRVLQRPLATGSVLAVFAVAVAVRVLIPARAAGGLGGNYGYDSSVYYAASDALLHGRLPYADFTLLHPPALVLALAPAALLGMLTTDHAGFIGGNLAFAVLGGVNAVLVVMVARRIPVPRVAAVVGGVVYALWHTCVVAETNMRLEPLANLFTLLGLLALAGDRRQPRSRGAVLAGFWFAAAASTKITWLAPLAVVVLWHLVDARSRRRARPLLLGVALGLAVLDGPFLLRAPVAMVRMVVLDQLGRPRAQLHVVPVLADLAGSTSGWTPDPPGAPWAAGALVAVVLGAAALAWRLPGARLAAVLMVVDLTVLVLGPRCAFYYGDLLAPPLCLTVAAAVGWLGPRARASRSRLALPTLAIAVLAPLAVVSATTAGLLVQHPPNPLTTPFPASRLQAAARKVGCVMSDSPMGLVELDVLSADLRRGCPNWVDVSGRTYDVLRGRTATGAPVHRVHNHRWQRAVRRYLTSGDAVVLVRAATGLDHATTVYVLRGPRLALQGGHALHATPH